jgi:hypothetical protein
MSYTIYFTDPTKFNDALIIDDQTGGTSPADTRFSVSFVKKNASNYATIISTNFLHLLENFANTEKPTGPVKGQLWFDTSNTDAPVLRINVQGTGASWAPASGVWAQSTPPNGDANYGQAKAGDIWVNTAQGQLYINTDGTTNNWTLVGPSFSGTLQTGSFPDTINDNFGVPHKIIKNFVDGNILEIISNDTFIPQSKIAGFTNILPGINVSSLNNAGLNATAYAAKNLYVTSPSNAYVPANNFVRNDIDNKITAALTVKDGILLGTNPTFTLKVNPLLARESQIINSVDGGIITFTIYNSAVANKLLRIDGVTQSLGIGIPDRPPAVTSGGGEVGGETLIGGTINVSSTGSTFNGSLSASTIISTGTITSGDDLTVGGQLYVNWNNGGSVGPAILPGTSGSPVTDTFDIGSPSAKFRFVYADNFQGNLGGTAQTANSLTNASAFAIQGDIQSTADVTYKGQLGTYVFATTITTAAITGKPVSSKVVAKDWTNFYNMPSNGAFNIIGVETTGTATISSNIVQIEKQNFLADIYANLVPTGAILPYAGLVAPDGWLLCDGQGAYKSQHPALFNAIGYTYGQPVPADSNIFGLPDLRGRGVVGYDDMDNGTFGLPNAGRVSSAVKPDGSIGSAATVAGGTSTVFLSTGTISTGTGVKTTVDKSISINVMNPYLAMNYIIKT